MRFECIQEVGFVHDRAARGVDENGVGFHQREVFAADQSRRLRRLPHVDAQDVRLPEDFVKRDPLRRISTWMKGPGNDAHAESFSQLRNFTADGAGSNQAQSFRPKLRHHGTRPPALPYLLVYLNQLFRNRHDQGDGVFGHGDRRHAGCVCDTDSPCFGRRQIDVVGSRSPNGNQAQLWTLLQDSCGKSRSRPDVDDDLGVADAGGQIVRSGRPIGIRSNVVSREFPVGHAWQHDGRFVIWYDNLRHSSFLYSEGRAQLVGPRAPRVDPIPAGRAETEHLRGAP